MQVVTGVAGIHEHAPFTEKTPDADGKANSRITGRLMIQVECLSSAQWKTYCAVELQVGLGKPGRSCSADWIVFSVHVPSPKQKEEEASEGCIQAQGRSRESKQMKEHRIQREKGVGEVS